MKLVNHNTVSAVGSSRIKEFSGNKTSERGLFIVEIGALNATGVIIELKQNFLYVHVW